MNEIATIIVGSAIVLLLVTAVIFCLFVIANQKKKYKSLFADMDAMYAKRFREGIEKNQKECDDQIDALDTYMKDAQLHFVSGRWYHLSDQEFRTPLSLKAIYLLLKI